MDYQNLVAIDTHTHLEVSCRNPFDNYGEEYDRAADKYFRSSRRPTMDETIAYYREKKIGFVNFTVDAETQLGRRRIPNEEIAEAALKNSDIMIAFGSIDPHKGRMGAREARKLIEEYGVKGFKFHPTVQGFEPQDHMAWPIYEVINEYKLPAVFHSGHSGIGSGMRCGGGLRLQNSNPMLLEDVAIAFPDMQIIVAHPSWPWQDEAISLAMHKPNIWVDLSGWSPKYFPPQLVQYANTLLRDRILFGSDYPLITPDRWLKDFEEAGFKPEVKPGILKDNAVRLLGLDKAAGMSGAFRGMADIEALERTLYDEAIAQCTTYGLIEQAARRFGDRTALRYLPDGDPKTPAHDVSYRTLLAQVHRAANVFRSLGAGPEDAVAILAPNIPETQFALWGGQLASRVCPINYLLQPDHIAALLQASGAKVLVALGPNGELDLWPAVHNVLAHTPLPVLQIRVGNNITPGVPVFQDLLAEQGDVLAFDPQLTPDRVAAYFHTGGTTGAPKLVQHTHGNEAHVSTFAHHFYGFDENTVEINGFPLFHVAGAFVYGLSLLAIGATQVLPTLSGMRNPDFVRNYWKFCERDRVTALACVPTILAMLVNLKVDADISSIKVAYTGGSPLPTELAVQFENRFGISVRNILGMTECAGLVSIEPFAASRVPGSTGLRLPYTDVRAVPWRDGAAQLNETCPTGETGVIVLRGPHVSPGYTDTTRNAGIFQGGWLVSGDLGHIDAQGYIHITGRAKDVIIRGSHNIDPGLVEEAFLAHPAVALCAVVGEPDAYAGELPVAFVTLKPGARCDSATLLVEVSPHVYERPATPKRVTVIDAMPVTAIGKIYKPVLRLRAIEAKIAEMLVDTAAVPGAEVRAEDRHGTLVAVVSLAARRDEALERRLREQFAAISVKIEFVFAEA